MNTRTIDIVREELNDVKYNSQVIINKLEKELYALETHWSNHVYNHFWEAEYTIFNYFENIARESCEGSYCYGESEYTQEFVVDGVHYLATVTFEYNRYDKQYYYIDGSNYSYKEIKNV